MANNAQIIKELKKGFTNFSLNKAIEISDNEAKTRMYLVEPFFEILRFNRGFENGNLIPEYDADFANMKGKKVDYAIMFNNKPSVIIEVKKSGINLKDSHLRQLNEYFLNTKESKIGILTNGIQYNFYCRNNSTGYGLHPTPFYSFNWEEFNSNDLDFLSKFYNTTIEVNKIIEQAQEYFFLENFELALFNELNSPSKEFIKSIYNNMGGNRLTDKIEIQIRNLINSISIKNALERLIIEESKNANSGIITTQQELKVFHVIKTILAHHKKIETKSIIYKDLKGKFCVLLELDGKTKKICDLYINDNSQRLDIDGNKFDIPDIDSIIKLKKKLTEKALQYLL